MEAKKYFDLDMAERIVRLVGGFGKRNEKIWGRKLQDRMCTPSNRTFNDCIFFLLRNDILATDSPRKVRRGQKVYFHLTATGIQILKYGIVRPFLEGNVLPNVPSKGKRRGRKAQVDKGDPRQELQLIMEEQEEIQQNRWKAIHFLLTRGAYGIGYNIPVGPEVALAKGMFQSADGVNYRSEHHEGVSIMDLVEQRDDNFLYINAHMHVSKPEAERIMQILLAEGIMEEMSQMNTTSSNGKGQDEDIRYGIKDKSLTEYVLQWGSFQNAVLGRMLYFYDSIRGVMRGIHAIESEVNWLRDAVGPGRAEKWLASAQDLRSKELIPYVYPSLQDINKLEHATQRSIHERRMEAIQEADRRILNTEHELRRNPELQEVEEKYPVITRIVKSSVYPDFLQEFYRRAKKKRKRKIKN